MIAMALLALMLLASPVLGAAPGFNPDFGCTLDTSLIAYWKLEEASGTRNDSKGTNHLTDNNTVTQNPGKVGNAGQFTRANSEYLSIADNADLSTGAIDFTIAAWVYIDSKIVANEAVILDKTDEYSFGHQVAATPDQFELAVGAGGTSVRASTFGSPSLATWYFVVAWRAVAGNTLSIQVNNGAVDSAGGESISDTANVVNMSLRTGTVRYWDGRIDEVGFWKRVLTAQERSDLYAGGAGNTYNSANVCLSSFVRHYYEEYDQLMLPLIVDSHEHIRMMFAGIIDTLWPRNNLHEWRRGMR